MVATPQDVLAPGAVRDGAHDGSGHGRRFALRREPSPKVVTLQVFERYEKWPRASESRHARSGSTSHTDGPGEPPQPFGARGLRYQVTPWSIVVGTDTLVSINLAGMLQDPLCPPPATGPGQDPLNDAEPEPPRKGICGG